MPLHYPRTRTKSAYIYELRAPNHVPPNDFTITRYAIGQHHRLHLDLIPHETWQYRTKREALDAIRGLTKLRREGETDPNLLGVYVSPITL